MGISVLVHNRLEEMNESVDETSAPWRWGGGVSRGAGRSSERRNNTALMWESASPCRSSLCLAERRQLRLLSVRDWLRQRCPAQLSLLLGGVSGRDALLRRPGEHPHTGHSAKPADCRYVLTRQRKDGHVHCFCLTATPRAPRFPPVGPRFLRGRLSHLPGALRL